MASGFERPGFIAPYPTAQHRWYVVDLVHEGDYHLHFAQYSAATRAYCQALKIDPWSAMAARGLETASSYIQPLSREAWEAFWLLYMYKALHHSIPAEIPRDAFVCERPTFYETRVTKLE